MVEFLQQSSIVDAEKNAREVMEVNCVDVQDVVVKKMCSQNVLTFEVDEV